MQIKSIFKQCALAFTAFAALTGAAHAATEGVNIGMLTGN